jgi:uncharacterized RDD family membrane protein YckC
MKPRHLFIAWLLLLAGAAIVPVQAVAQTPPPVPGAPAPDTPPAPILVEPRESNDDSPFDNSQDRVRFGQDFTLREGDTANDVVVVMGNATIEGHARGDVVVILGAVRIGSNAIVDGDFVAVGGSVRVAEGGQLHKDFVVVGGNTDLPPDFAPGGEQTIVGSGIFGARFERFLPWFTRGLLLGRPLVPNLPWMWVLVGLAFLCYLVINQLADGPVAGTAATLMERPLTSFGSGLLVLLLLGPVCLLLAISVVGLAVIPFVICAVIIAGLIGKVGVIRWVGLSAMRESSADSALEALLAFMIGFAMLAAAYMVPVLGLATWAIASVLGLGAAALAFMGAYKREQPVLATAAASPFSAVPPPLPQSYSAPASGVNMAPPAPVPATYNPGASQSAPASTVPPPAAAAAPPSAGFAIPASHLATGPAATRLLPRAAFRERFAALVLDVILVIIVVQLGDLLDSGRATFLGMLVYHIGFWTWKQTTVGGMICQLKIVRTDGAPLTFADALVRGLSAIFSVVVVFIGFLWVIRDPERQAWHDKVAGTYVVKVPRAA